MGKKIVSSVRRMGWQKKTSLVVLMALMVSLVLYGYNPGRVAAGSASVTKTYDFLSSSQSWVGVTGTSTTAAWNSAGYLTTTITGRSKTDATAGWNITGLTWEALGVPAGATVVSVDGSYSWYCSTYTTGAASNSGALTITDSADANSTTLENGVSFSAVTTSATQNATGAVAVPAALQASNSAIKIKLLGTLATGNSATASVARVSDNVSLIINYTFTTPTIASPTSASVGLNSATLGATVSTTGGAAITDYGVVWNTTGNPPSLSDTKVSLGANPTLGTAYTTGVSGLPANTKIYYAGYATNSAGTAFTSQANFTTATTPTVTTPTATSLASTTATLGATVTNSGGLSVTDYGIVWNTTGSPTIADNKVSLGSNPTIGTPYTSSVSGLPAGTKVYYAGYATNAGGTTYSYQGGSGVISSFYTEPATQASNVLFSGVTGTGMTVTWTKGSGDGSIVLVKAGSAVAGTPADGTFSYTANPAYGSGTLVGDGYTAYLGTGNSVTLSGLTSGTTYYVAVFAYSGSSSTSGYSIGTNYRTASPATGNALAQNTAPSIGTVTVTPTSGSYTNASPTLSAQVVLASGGVSGCEYTTDGSTWLPGTLTGSGSPWSCSATTSGLTGSRTFNVRATAPGGTGTGSAVSRTVDAGVPALSAQSPADGASVPLDGLLLTATATDAGSGVSQYRILMYDSNHQPLSDTGWQASSGSISYAPTGLAYNSAYYWDLFVQDAVGNVYDGTANERLFSTKGACVHNDPSVTLSTSTNAISTKIVTDGGSASYNLKIANNDVGGCADSAFTLTPANNNTDASKFNTPALSAYAVTLPVGTSQTVTMTVSAKSANGGEVSGVAYSTGSVTAANHNAVTSNQVLTVLNVAGCTVNAPLLTIGPNSLYATRGGSTQYTVSVKNTDVGANCTPTTFTLANLGDSSSGLFSSSLSAAMLTLAPGQANTVYLTVSAASGATNGTSDVTTVGVSATGHPAPSNSTATTTVGDLMLHNSDNLSSTKWGAGGWGIPGGRYGEFVCSTCHVPGGTDTSNIKKIREAVFTPYTGAHQHLPGEGKRIAFTKRTGTQASDNTFGWDATTTKTLAPVKICEACHTYDASGANGSKHHAQTSASLYSHFDGQDCIRCHKHNQAFGTGVMACNACHGDTTATINADGSNRYVVAPPGNANGVTGTLTGTGQVSNDSKVGAHQTHLKYLNGFSNYSTVDYRCQACHGALPTNTTHIDGGYNLNSANTFQKMATRNGSFSASYNATNQSCNVYCHNPAGAGGTLSNPGLATQPSWTDATYLADGGKSQTNCNRCHLVPGDAGFTFQSAHGAGMVTNSSTDCSGCHGHNGDLTGSLGQRHLDGVRYANGNCNTCHGYDTTDSGTTWNPALSGGSGSGAHVKHINFIKSRLGLAALTPNGQTFGLGEPAAICGTCHTNTLAQHKDSGREISFGAGGTTYTMGAGYTGSMSLLFGSSNPSFDPTGKTCSNISCHFATTPSWY